MNDVKLKTTQINGSFLLPLFHKKAVQLVLQEAGREQQSEKWESRSAVGGSELSAKNTTMLSAWASPASELADANQNSSQCA